jgi:AcrR family transcriptional regulator
MAARLSNEARRGSIMEAAIQVFAGSGFRGATTSALAKAAGITEALLYRHFRSKKQLFLGAVEQVLATVDHEVELQLAAHEHPVDALEGLLEYFQSELRRHPQFGELSYTVANELHDPEMRAVYLLYQDRILKRFEDAIRGWERDGYVRPGVDARAAAWIILGASQTLTLMQKCDRLDEIKPEHVRAFVTAFLVEGARHG